MPQFYYKCPKCGASKRRIFSLEESKEPQACECGEAMVRNPKPPSSSSKEKLDNGIMSKAVERYTDAEELYQGLNDADKKLRE